MKQEEKTKLTRQKILDAGIAEFGTNGYEKANINSISASGIAKGLIYHNFASKDELYLECLRVCFDEITEALDCPESIADYSVYFSKRICLFRERRAAASMVLEALINPPKKHLEEIAQIRTKYDRMNAEWLTKILKNDRLRDGITEESALKYLTLAQDMFNWYCTNPKFDSSKPEDLIELHERELPRIFEFMLRGVLKGE